ncbi:YihY/virulence factor BrkB family protein [Actinospongicola halichondriae]|uniref:YihY/virulence factor BrkB family protein n=1 Tax=Actinospongicola halichondriae TaxID=3236844 RepID=UPI003D51CB4F
MKERLASVPVIGWLLRVQERFGEIRGTALANGIALQTFLSIFPLVIVGVAVIGFLAVDDPDFAQSVIDNLELDGDSAESFNEAIATAQDSRQAASAIGLAGLLFSGLNLVTAIQRSIDAAWQTHGKGLVEKLKALAWLGGATLIFIGSFGLAIALNVLPAFLAPISLLAGFGVNVLLFLWTFTALGRVPVGWRARLPGALLCAFGFEIMKVLGSVYVPKLVADSSALYGSLGVVFAVLAWLAIFGRLLVYGSVVNVIRWEDTHGTVRVQIDAPRVDGALALETNRTGAVIDTLDR